MQENNQWTIKKVNDEFHQATKLAIELLNNQGNFYDIFVKKIKIGLEELNERSLLKVTFVGQYSAGKSTIVTAITGNKNINIDADIATIQAENYHWNGIIITDTPGLFTERKDHDARTYEAIQNSDLLIFVLTSDLFDDIILNNFIKLAYEQAYRNKMMIVVNKMSMESGDYEKLKANYFHSLQEVLLPYDIQEFTISFIDAADYLEGKADAEAEIVEMSHFDEFIGNLNNFVEKKGLLGKLDTPIRLVIAEIDKALLETNTDNESIKFFSLLNRIEDRVKQSLKNSQFYLDKISSQVRSRVVSLGSELALSIGQSDLDFEDEQNKVELKIREITEQASEKMAQLLAEERENLNEEIVKVFESDLGQAYLNSLDYNDININNVEISDMSNIQKNFKTINEITTKLTKGGLNLLGKTDQPGLYKASAVASSDLHKGVYSVGKFFGYKFKPWQAANTAKVLGNVMKVVGPILAIASLIFEIAGQVKEHQDLQKVLNAKKECSSSFVALAGEIQNQFQNQFNLYKSEFYDDILSEIAEKRKVTIDNQDNQTEFAEKLLAIRDKLYNLIQLTIKGTEA